jgi:hypothetical protein
LLAMVIIKIGALLQQPMSMMTINSTLLSQNLVEKKSVFSSIQASARLMIKSHISLTFLLIRPLSQ